MRIKEQETRLTLQEHVDDDDMKEDEVCMERGTRVGEEEMHTGF